MERLIKKMTKNLKCDHSDSLAHTTESTVEPSANDLMTVEEVPQYLRVPVSWVYGRTRSRGIPMVRVGKHIRIPRSALIDWLAAPEA